MHLFELVFSHSLGKYPEEDLLDHMVTVLKFLRSLHTLCHNCCTNLQSHQQWRRFPFSLHPREHLLFLVFFIIVILKDEIVPFATTWMNLKIIMLSEISQMEKDKNYMISPICRV